MMSTSNSDMSIPETSSIREIKYLSCQGGGMKGIGYVGAIQELDRLGILDQLEEVAGSSAGGLFAVMVAIGCTADELKTEMLNLDFRAFQDKREIGWVEASKVKQLVKGGAALASRAGFLSQLVKDVPVVGKTLSKVTPAKLAEGAFNIAANVASGAEKAEDLLGLALGEELGLFEGDALMWYLANLVARKTGNPNITFRELASLAEASGSPFKKLILTGSNLSTKKLEYYSAETTPDMPIVQAARISASFPGAYKPVVLADGQTRVDGGLLENLPDVFNKIPYLTNDSFNNASGGNKYAFALSFVTEKDQKSGKTIKTAPDLAAGLYEAKMNEDELQKKYGENIAYINTVGMGTLEFEANEEKKHNLVESGATSIADAFKKILQKEEVKQQSLPAKTSPERTRQKTKWLEAVTKQLEKNLEQLELAKIGLEFSADILLENYRNNKEFREQIKALRDIEHEIKGKTFAEDPINESLEKRKKCYQQLIEGYEKRGNTPLADFFRDLQADSENPDFFISKSESEFKVYVWQDIRSCENYISEARRELEAKKASTYKSEQFKELVDLNKQLNETLHRKTTLLTKMNHFILQKAPKLERAILGFSRAVALVSFVCFLPAAIPCVGFAKLVKQFSKENSARATADNVIDFFRLTDVVKENSLRKLREETTLFLRKMNQNYAKADKAEITYLQKLYQCYLGNSGLKIEDIFIRKPGESPEAHFQRIQTETEKLFLALKQPEKVEKESIKNIKGFDNFRHAVQLEQVGALQKTGRAALQVKFQEERKKRLGSAYGKLNRSDDNQKPKKTK
jgi:predicted acylesterase/phospholipase RssA